MKKILMFGFRDLGEIMKIAAAAERCGAELQPVGRESCTLTLEALSQGKTRGAIECADRENAGILRTGRELTPFWCRCGRRVSFA